MTIYYWGIDNVMGGMENYAYNLISGIICKSEQIKFIVLTQFDDYKFRNILEKQGVKSIILPKWKKHPLKFYKHLLSILETSNKDDIFQINLMTYRNFFLLKAAKKTKIKTFIVSHGSKVSDKKFRLLNYFVKFLYRKCFFKIAVSNKARNFLFFKKDKVAIIPNGINAKYFSFSNKERERIRKKLNLDSTCICIGHIGRISDEKNQKFSLKLAHQLAKIHPKYKLLIIGEGNKAFLNKQINKYKINNIILLDSKSDIAKYYNALDLLIVPSKNEGLPFVILEGSANGLKILASSNIENLENLNNIKYSKLIINDWLKYILLLDKRNSINYLNKTKFELESMLDSYYKLYIGSFTN